MNTEHVRNVRRKYLFFTAAAILLLTVAAVALLVPSLSQPTLPPQITREQYDRAAADWIGLFRTAPFSRRHAHAARRNLAQTATTPRCRSLLFRDRLQSLTLRQKRRLQEAQILLKLNQAAAAEQSFKTFLSLAAASPNDTDSEQLSTARHWLAWLMAVQLRFEDRVEWLDQLLNAGQADVYDAKQRFFPTLLIWASSLGSSRLREFAAIDSENPALLIAAARYETAEGRPEVASAALRKVRQSDPDNLHALAALLEATFEMNLLEEFIALNKTAPAFSPTEPWLLTQMRAEAAIHLQALD
ncbi:MAG UNVERIFIED_CONTAM: hypothetical protein LVR18_05710 [Planctomycetaceae bacterium]|jgi:hypothetical protein